MICLGFGVVWFVGGVICVCVVLLVVLVVCVGEF